MTWQKRLQEMPKEGKNPDKARKKLPRQGIKLPGHNVRCNVR
ncbi:MAG TPA: hypothetical protein VJR22_05140 [Candidatus Nitrosotalea sp.]|nr:hypothetical protein [Candidatus Nitrosotalea sp.]